MTATRDIVTMWIDREIGSIAALFTPMISRKHPCKVTVNTTFMYFLGKAKDSATDSERRTKQ